MRLAQLTQLALLVIVDSIEFMILVLIIVNVILAGMIVEPAQRLVSNATTPALHVLEELVLIVLLVSQAITEYPVQNLVIVLA